MQLPVRQEGVKFSSEEGVVVMHLSSRSYKTKCQVNKLLEAGELNVLLVSESGTLDSPASASS